MLKHFLKAAPAASRRGFLLGATAFAGGLMVGFEPRDAEAQTVEVNPLQGYVIIEPDETVTIISAHMDMGQGIYHGLATLLNEELMADWANILVEGGSGNPKLYGNLPLGGTMQLSGASTGTPSSFDRYRRAGAVARQMLVNAAAAEWKVPAADIRVENGILSHGQRRATFGEFAAKAAALPVPTNVALKPASEWRFIGKERDVLSKYDSRVKSTGKQEYTIDVKLPGLLTAVMIHPPLFGAKVKRFDAANAKTMRGVVDVVQIPSGIAIVADNMWRAIQAREAVSVEWDETGAGTVSTSELMKAYVETSAQAGKAVATSHGDVAKGFASATKTIEATYEFPYLAHAALEPLNAVARIADGFVDTWGGHQMPDLDQIAAAKIAGVTPDKVRLHVMKTGGGFGRRAELDGGIVAEAVSVSKAIGGRPVRVQWTRDNDMRGGRYRPAFVHRFKGGLDAAGNIVAWHNHIVGQSITAGTPFEGLLIKNGVDVMSVEGADKIPYAMPNMRVELTSTEVAVPAFWWRSVANSHTGYAVESFIDELAEAAGKDPLDFRLAMMKEHPRHAAVLRLAAEKADWGKLLPAGVFRGLALVESFGSIAAEVVEISAPKDAVKVHRVVCAIDCGIVINPDNVRAQMEGGIGFGLSAILKSKITLDKGRVVEGNYDTYDVLRISEMPRVEVHIVPSTEAPAGVGEPGVPPIGPAVANAYFAATGRRVRALPFNA